MKGKGKVAELINAGEILISHHARVRMFERNISTDDIITGLSTVEGGANHDSGSLQLL